MGSTKNKKHTEPTFTANEAAEQLGIPTRTLQRYANAIGVGQRGGGENGDGAENPRGRYRFSKGDVAKIQAYQVQLAEKIANIARENGSLSAGRPPLDPKTGRPIKRKSGRK